MSNAKVSQFVEHYNNLDEWALFEIHRKRASLTEDAIVALNQVIAHPGIDIAKMAKVETEESERDIADAREQQTKFETRSSLFLKIAWIVAMALIVLGALLHPDRSIEILVSAVTQAMLLGLAYWGYLKLKRSRIRKSQTHSRE